jgi:hypothetical protein
MPRANARIEVRASLTSSLQLQIFGCALLSFRYAKVVLLHCVATTPIDALVKDDKNMAESLQRTQNREPPTFTVSFLT